MPSLKALKLQRILEGVEDTADVYLMSTHISRLEPVDGSGTMVYLVGNGGVIFVKEAAAAICAAMSAHVVSPSRRRVDIGEVLP